MFLFCFVTFLFVVHLVRIIVCRTLNFFFFFFDMPASVPLSKTFYLPVCPVFAFGPSALNRTEGTVDLFCPCPPDLLFSPLNCHKPSTTRSYKKLKKILFFFLSQTFGTIKMSVDCFDQEQTSKCLTCLIECFNE